MVMTALMMVILLLVVVVEQATAPTVWVSYPGCEIPGRSVVDGDNACNDDNCDDDDDYDYGNDGGDGDDDDGDEDDGGGYDDYDDDDDDGGGDFQIGAGLYAVGRPVQKRNDEDGQIGTIQSLLLERGALFNRFFGEPAHGPPHVAGGASGPIGGCRDESRTDNPDLDLRHVFDRNNRKTDLI